MTLLQGDFEEELRHICVDDIDRPRAHRPASKGRGEGAAVTFVD
jgi:hypothetical protein